MSFEQVREWCRNRHKYAQNWKEKNNGKVLGYFCTYVPEEIIYAAGVLPVRIFGSHEPADDAEPYIFGMYCPFSRDCLSQAIRGRYKYLDATMLTQTCLHIRNTFWTWQKVSPTSFHYFLCFPMKIQSQHALNYAYHELVDFKKAFETWVGREIDSNALKQSINIYNENRSLISKIYQHRKRDDPPITGQEAMEVVLSSQITDKKEHNEALRKILASLDARVLKRETGVRLMIIGSEDDDTEFIGYLEELGATVVIDEHCTGTRYFLGNVLLDMDHLRAIAHRYLTKPHCPNRDWDQRTRTVHILNLAKEYNVQGAILIQQKFCDPHEFDVPIIKNTLESNGIPTLFLEFDVTIPFGQFRTRIEAFLEMIRAEALF